MREDAAIVLQARMGSKRLPGKIMEFVAGRTILAHCVNRLRARSGLPVIVATTTRAEDDRIADAAKRLGAEVVRGAEDHVLARYVQAAVQYSLRDVVRATADNPAVDMDAPCRTLDLLRRTGADYVVERGLPIGAAVEAVSVEALLLANALTTDTYDCEHVTPLIRRSPEFVSLEAIAPGALRRPELRLTVDTQDDLDFVREVMAQAATTDPAPASLAAIIAAADRIKETSALTGSGAPLR